ncbi:sensor histidine kinase [Croceiramulus getboli]|nr:ATP-binding protein [Flavobacteriaceae bacterium YJPT1-3]
MTLLLFAVIFFILFAAFIKRKNSLVLEQQEAEKRYERLIAETQIEIREETLRNISWELHDNIGQLLTLAKIKAQNIIGGDEAMMEVSETIGKGLNELRALSKSINPEAIKNLSLHHSVRQEVERFNRLQFLEASLQIEGEPRVLDDKVEVVLFRILQEFFTNTIKHSKASALEVLLNYTPDHLEITAKDNGIGFTPAAEGARGIGLGNMKKRGELIQADITITSTADVGTALRIHYKYPEL